ncbi:hypothetical protein SSCG_05250 [Streptomyces clavuligerus]|nr:hypothetical protein SSCG_05250 [Streptomyces clavuligerus]
MKAPAVPAGIVSAGGADTAPDGLVEAGDHAGAVRRQRADGGPGRDEAVARVATVTNLSRSAGARSGTVVRVADRDGGGGAGWGAARSVSGRGGEAGLRGR